MSGGGDGPWVLCVAGDSDSGKTRLLAALLPRLPLPPDRVGVLKHTHHAVDWHPEGKDSARLWAAGPGALAVAGPDQTALFVRREGEAAPGDPDEEVAAASTRRLAEGCRRMPPGIRLVLAEGFRAARAPKIWTAAGGPEPGPPAPGVRAVIAPGEHAAAWREALPGAEVLEPSGAAEALAPRAEAWAAALSELPLA